MRRSSKGNGIPCAHLAHGRQDGMMRRKKTKGHRKADSLNRVAWFDLEVWSEAKEHQYCEAPRHQDLAALEIGVPPADYVMILHAPEEGYEYQFQATCRECMDRMAKDLGTTAEEGKLTMEKE